MPEADANALRHRERHRRPAHRWTSRGPLVHAPDGWTPDDPARSPAPVLLEGDMNAARTRAVVVVGQQQTLLEPQSSTTTATLTPCWPFIGTGASGPRRPPVGVRSDCILRCPKVSARRCYAQASTSIAARLRSDYH